MPIYKCNICSNEYCCQNDLDSHNLLHINENNYNICPKLCVECNTPIPYDKRHNKTCSRLCSALQGNKNREKRSSISRKNSSIALKKFYHDNPKPKINFQIIDRECSVCSKTFTPIVDKKGKDRGNKTCSKECLTISNKINGSINGRKSSKVRQLRSKKEIELSDLCKSYYSNVLSNHIIADNWDADIVLPDHKVAILWNGPWHYRDMNIKGVSLSQIQNRDRIKTALFSSLGWSVIAFRDDCVTPNEAFDILLETL